MNLGPGITYSIQVLQDAVGGRIVTFPGAYSDFDYVGQEAYSGPEFTTIYQLTAHTSSTGAISTYAGNAFVSVAYNFAGVDGDPNFGFRPGFSVPNDRGGEFRGSVRLGRTSGLETSFYQPLDTSHRWFIEPGLTAQRSIEDLFDDGNAVTRYDFSSGWGYLDAGHAFGKRAELRAGIRSGVQAAAKRA